jgi:integrase
MQRAATSPLPRGYRIKRADGMKYAAKKYTVKQINALVEQIRSSKPPQLPERQREERYYDPALTGFYILLLNTGVARWVVQYKRLARQKKIRLGDVKVLDRQQAIKAGRELLAKVTLGLLDPHEARRERMRANKVTFATLTPLFIERKKQVGELKPNTERRWKPYLITSYYFKPLHNLPVDEITGDQIQTCIDIIASQSGNAAANDCYKAISVFFKWAINTRKLPVGHHNPMTGIQAPARNRSRERVLSDDEIRLIWKILCDWEVQADEEQIMGKRSQLGRRWDPHAPRAVKLLFLTGCRSHEIGGLQWPEVEPLDNAELFIPGSRRKSQRSKEPEMDLCVPLADMAVQILRGVAKRPDRITVFGRSRAISGLNLHGMDMRIDRRIAKTGGTPPPDWTVHDIRRTFRTRLAQLGISMDVGEALLGHTGHRNQNVRTYNRHEYWAEKRQALALWEAHLRAIIDGTAEKIVRPRFGERKKENPA